MKTLFIAWEKYHARTDLLGKALGAQVHFIAHLGRVSGPRLLLKYLLQSVDTLRLLRRERPDVILVQSPPVFLPLLATLYAGRRPGTRVVIDAHSGTFLSRKWAWSLPALRWCARRARLTVVHMRSLAPLVQGWGAPVLEMGYWFALEAPPTGETYALPPGTNIVVPCSFNADEPIDLVWAAAARQPGVRFHLTGDARRLPAELLERKPDNVIMTGYLSTPAYLGLLRGADAVLALTTQDQTFQTGGAEAVWLGRPLILSDWPELRRVFYRGTVFTSHDPDGLASAVSEVQARGPALRHDMVALKREFDTDLQDQLRRLQAVISGGDAPRLATVGDWVADKEG